MNADIVKLSWEKFEIDMQKLAATIEDAIKVLGIPNPVLYGPPRGGLCIAVKLSHLLGIPVTLNEAEGTIWVDDVFETGRTVQENFELYPKALRFTWVSKRNDVPFLYDFVQFVDPTSWIIFPWENADKAEADANEYYASRNIEL